MRYFYNVHHNKRHYYMQIIQANISHLDAFLAYAKQCADDGLHLYSSTIEDHQAYFKKRLAYVKVNNYPHIGLLSPHTSVLNRRIFWGQ